MPISFGSINTGLPPNIVQQLIEAERQPVKALEAKKGKEQEKLKLVDDLTTKVREIQKGIGELGSTRGFVDLKMETGDANVISGAVDKNVAQPGTYEIEVEKLAVKTSAASNGFPDKDRSQVGIGYFKAYMPDGTTKEIFVDKKNNTLEKLAQLINRNAIGIQASVINDRSDKEDSFKLLLSGKGIGEDGVIKFPQFYFLDGDQDFFLDKERPAQNGKVKIDGFEFETKENKLVDAIPGVTLDLKSAAPGKEIYVNISEDKEIIEGKIRKFVESCNAVFQFVQAQNTLDEKSDTSKTLGGDSLLRNVQNRLQQALQDPVFGPGKIKYLNEIGITFQRNGTLALDEEKFKAVLTKDPAAVTSFFIGDNQSYGLAPRLRSTMSNLLDNVTGPLPGRSRGLQDKIRQIDDQIANKERILAQREITLKNQFSRLEETMSQMKSQGAFLAARLGSPEGAGGGFNLSGASSS